MATTSEFRNGMVLRMEGELYSIVEFQHVNPGKGGAFVRTRLKNVKTGRVLDRTFRSGEKVEDVRLDRRSVQFLYKHDTLYFFMDMENYEQLTASEEIVGGAARFICDGMEVEMLMHDKEPLGVEPPIFVELEVIKAEPGLRGDTATGATKPATLNSGAVIQVPLFINEGDKVRVDTRTGYYVERVK